MKFKDACTSLIGLTIFAVSSAASANVIDARFDGTVNSQANTTFAVGSAIAGEFIYDTSLGHFLMFTIGGQLVAPGFISTASVTPDLFSGDLSGSSVASAWRHDQQHVRRGLGGDQSMAFEQRSCVAAERQPVDL
jgi:hypothetical protein